MVRRLALLASVIILSSHTALPTSAGAIVLDGLRDPAYVLLTTDPVGDVPASVSLTVTREWADLTALYAFTTTTHLFVYIALPAYAHDRSSGQIGLTIDTTGDLPGSGGAADPWNNPITYAYTSTHHLSGTVPHTTTHTLLPDAVIRGNLACCAPPADVDLNDGWTELRLWTGTAWAGAANNWGGLESEDLTGDHIAYADSHGVELAIPLAEISATITNTLHLQAYTTQRGYFNGAYDSIPSEPAITSIYSPTVQHAFTTLEQPTQPEEPPPPPPDTLPVLSFAAAVYQANEAAGSVLVSVVASGTVTQAVSVTAHALPGTASPLDFTPLTSTLTLSPTHLFVPFTLTLFNDAIAEPDETILLDLASPQNALLGQPAAAVLTLLDDDDHVPLLWRLLLPLILR
jgi:hypothetical protein